MSKKRLKILILCALGGIVIVIILSRISRPMNLETATLSPAQPEESSLIVGGMPLQATSSASSTITSGNQTSGTPSSLPTGTLITTFSPPYPFAWDENGDRFAITGAVVGTSLLSYSPGTLAIRFTLSITTGARSTTCVPIPLALVADEAGTLQDSLTRQFVFPESGGCVPKAHTTYEHNHVLFAIPKDQEYLFTTGGNSNLFFNVGVVSGTISITPVGNNG